MKRPRAHSGNRLVLQEKNHKSNWIRSLLQKGFKPEVVVLEEFQEAQAQELAEAERWNIEYYRSIGCDLTNLTRGGDGPSGWKPSEETRTRMRIAALRRAPRSAETLARMSASLMGHSVSNETRQKISLAKKGRSHAPHSEETRAKIAAANRRRVVSAETRAKMSARRKGRKMSREQANKISATLRARFCSA